MLEEKPPRSAMRKAVSSAMIAGALIGLMVMAVGGRANNEGKPAAERLGNLIGGAFCFGGIGALIGYVAFRVRNGSKE
jgi:hypothetical protein